MDADLKVQLDRIEAKINTLVTAKSGKEMAQGAFGGAVQIPQAAPKKLTPQLNAYPEPGVEYPVIDNVPTGFHIEYDWANHEAVLCKTC